MFLNFFVVKMRKMWFEYFQEMKTMKQYNNAAVPSLSHATITQIKEIKRGRRRKLFIKCFVFACMVCEEMLHKN